MIVRPPARCYATGVRQLIAMLMLCVLLLSHGGMGGAVPHVHADEVANVEGHADEVSEHGHADEAVASVMDAPDNDRSDSSTGFAFHAHVIGDVSRPVEWGRSPLGVAGPKLMATIASAPPSRGVAPLLEPPSA